MHTSIRRTVLLRTECERVVRQLFSTGLNGSGTGHGALEVVNRAQTTGPTEILKMMTFKPKTKIGEGLTEDRKRALRVMKAKWRKMKQFSMAGKIRKRCGRTIAVRCL